MVPRLALSPLPAFCGSTVAPRTHGCNALSPPTRQRTSSLCTHLTLNPNSAAACFLVIWPRFTSCSTLSRSFDVSRRFPSADRCWSHHRADRKDNTALRSFRRTNACLDTLDGTITIGMCVSAQCAMRKLARVPISRAIDASDMYFFLNLVIDCSEILNAVGVFQPSSNLSPTSPGIQGGRNVFPLRPPKQFSHYHSGGHARFCRTAETRPEKQTALELTRRRFPIHAVYRTGAHE
jgi:hypothetical protein